MEYTSEQKKLINRVFCLFGDNLTCLDCWGHYLQNEPEQSELRSKAGVIWVASLYDSVKAESSYIPSYKLHASNLDLNYLQRYLEQALEFISVIKSTLMVFTKEEQVFFTYLRNQMVHSFLHGRHENSFKIKYVENNQFITEDIEFEKYHELTRSLFEQGNIMKTASTLLKKVLNFQLHYWKIAGEIQAKRNEIYEHIKKGKEFNWETINV